jgi:hypothetical protein
VIVAVKPGDLGQQAPSGESLAGTRAAGKGGAEKPLH